MIIEEKTVVLKNGCTVLLKTPGTEDAKALIHHMGRTAEESWFLTRYPEEIIITPEEEAAYLQRMRDGDREAMVGAYDEGKLVGSCSIQPMGNHIKTRHRAGVGIAIRRAYWGLGLGTALMEEILKLARQACYEQVELGVFADNHRAVELYRKMGFHEVGRQPRAYRLKDGSCRDEIRMLMVL